MNGYKQYLKSRPGASVESVKRSRDFKNLQIGDHPLLCKSVTGEDKQRGSILEEMKNYRPKSTIFEIGNTTKNKAKIEVMNLKRKKHENVIDVNAKKQKIDGKYCIESMKVASTLAKSTDEDLDTAFETIVKSTSNKALREKKRKEKPKDENYIPYEATDKHTEAGYSLNSGFSAQVIQDFF